MSKWFKLLQRLSTAVAIVFFAALSGPASAADQQTIDDIIKKGKIVVGVSTTTPIFGLIGKDGEPEGYDPDVARLLAKYSGQREFSRSRAQTASPSEVAARRSDRCLHHARACATGRYSMP